MKTDRELLELAAKAAGIDVDAHDCFGAYIWDPLDDDGDALRLAVAIGARLTIKRGHPAHVNTGAECMIASLRVFEGCMDNDAAYQRATRRAIVRAAAEIGRKMP